MTLGPSSSLGTTCGAVQETTRVLRKPGAASGVSRDTDEKPPRGAAAEAWLLLDPLEARAKTHLTGFLRKPGCLTNRGTHRREVASAGLRHRRLHSAGSEGRARCPGRHLGAVAAGASRWPLCCPPAMLVRRETGGSRGALSSPSVLRMVNGCTTNRSCSTWGTHRRQPCLPGQCPLHQAG